MREGSRANTLLLELLLVILFFMLACTTIVEIFGQARMRSEQATVHNEAMLQAENIAEKLYNAADETDILTEIGFARSGDIWSMTVENAELQVNVSDRETEAGLIRSFEISATEGDTELFMLPVSRYLPKEVAP